MFRKRNRILLTLIFILAALFAIACGKGNDSAAPDASAPVSPAASSASPEQTPAASGTASPPASEAAPEAQFRTVTGKNGEVQIPVNPEKVVGMYLEDHLIALGVHPIFKADNYAYLNIPDTPTYDMWEDSIEKMVEAEPDLILLSYHYEDKMLEAFEKVAPTLVFNWDWAETTWRDQLKAVGELLGQAEKAGELLAAFETRLQETKTALDAATAGKKVAVLRVDPGRLMLYGDDRGGGFIGPLLYGDLALTPPDIVRKLTWGNRDPVIISEEAIPEIDADFLFILTDKESEDHQTELKKLEASPIWQALPAVKNKEVAYIDNETWLNNGLLSHYEKLKDLEAAILK